MRLVQIRLAQGQVQSAQGHSEPRDARLVAIALS